MRPQRSNKTTLVLLFSATGTTWEIKSIAAINQSSPPRKRRRRRPKFQTWICKFPAKKKSEKFRSSNFWPETVKIAQQVDLDTETRRNISISSKGIRQPPLCCSPQSKIIEKYEIILADQICIEFDHRLELPHKINGSQFT